MSDHLAITNQHVELFVIEPEVAAACSMEEIMATYNDLQKLGMANLPYANMDIQYPQIMTGEPHRCVIDHALNGSEIFYHALSIRDNLVVDIKIGPTIKTLRSAPLMLYEISRWSPEQREAVKAKVGFGIEKCSTEENLVRRGQGIICLLIVLLATRNVVKDRQENKLWKLGIGRKKNSARYTTTIRLPATVNLADDAEHSQTGERKRPHLRRGHIRHQRYGKALAYVKEVWIEPCFINADEEFVASRSAYTLRSSMN